MLNLLNQSRKNTIIVTRNLLKLLKIPVTETTLADTLFTHPDYPSLLSISDSLNRWKVATVAIKATEENLNELPLPFIVHLKTRGGQFITVKSITEDKIIYLDQNRKEKHLTKEEFRQQWDGVVLLAEADETPSGHAVQAGKGEPDYKKVRRREWWDTAQIPLGLIILFVLGLIQVLKFSIPGYAGSLYYMALTFFSFLGVLVTGLLLWHEYDGNNPLLQKVCSAGQKSGHGGGDTGCQAVIGSKASKAIGNITWSEIGFIYFTGSYLYLLIAGIPSLTLFMILNILALPYIFYSIYYQARIAKQWCVLCLGVQSLLLLEFLTALFTNHLTIQPSNHLTIQPSNHLTIQPSNHLTIELFILSYFIPTFTWFFAKPYLYAAKEGKQFRYQLARLKNNEDVFNALLQKQLALPQNPDGMGITIGNPGAKNILIKVCNPYCGPCAKAHPKIEALIHNNSNWKAQIIFTATGNEKDRRSAPAAHLMAIATQHDETKTQQALDDWYNAPKKEYDLFAEKYPMDGELKLQKEKLQAMDKWCKEVKVTATPTFFVKKPFSNGEEGYKLPGQYGVEDLMYL